MATQLRMQLRIPELRGYEGILAEALPLTLDAEVATAAGRWLTPAIIDNVDSELLATIGKVPGRDPRIIGKEAFVCTDHGNMETWKAWARAPHATEST